MGLSSLEKLLDPYERKARLFPGLLVCLPIAITVLCIAGSVDPLFKVAISLMVTCGMPFLLSNIARDAGKKIEDRLFTKWGGMPSTQLLRHTNGHFDRHTKQRYHEIVTSGAKIPMPTPEDELTNPQGADEAYRAAGFWLRERTKNPKEFPHVFRENVAYGFRRNATGLKHVGFLIALLCVLALLASPAYQAINNEDEILKTFFLGMSLLQAISIIVSGAFMIVWAACFSENSLRRSATAYADRLIRSCVEFKQEQKTRTKPAALA
ncbi:hypothetical protein [Rhizobium sp.]|uniref:hypothetical protein n=1 Tax=Rhizobium sp. TaxID=391 RepID=UPI0028A695C9